eukprot:3472160-Amphidinium_carterae.1
MDEFLSAHSTLHVCGEPDQALFQASTLQGAAQAMHITSALDVVHLKQKAILPQHGLKRQEEV